MEKLYRVVRSVYPDTPEALLRPETLLGDLAGWDSMSSITFALEIEKEFSVNFADVILEKSQDLAGLTEMLKKLGASVG